MPIFENKSGLNYASVREEDMDKVIPEDKARSIYSVAIGGFGNSEGFEDYYVEGMIYKDFIEKLVNRGLLIQVV